MTHEIILQQLEPKLRAIARRFTFDKTELEDFEQVGRMTVWEVLEKNPQAGPEYILKAVEYSCINVVRAKYAKKRNPGKIFSLDTRSSSNGSSLMDLLLEGPESTAEESMETFIDGLKSLFGKRYISEIRRQHTFKEKARGIVRAVIEGVHKIPVPEIPKSVDYDFFVRNKLQRFLWVFYKNSPIAAVIDAYPNEIVPFQFRRKPQRFWRGPGGRQRAVDSIHWFCQKRGINQISDCRHVMWNDFEEEGLDAMLGIHFHSSPYQALKIVFPELRPWQTNQTAANYFDSKSKRKEALDFYLMEHGVPLLDFLTPEEVYDYGLRTFVTKDDLSLAGLTGLAAKYNCNLYRMFLTLYPGKIYPWTLGHSKEAWREKPKEKAARAMRWLFDDYLQIPIPKIPQYATCSLLWRVGFSGIMTNRNVGYSSSPFRAVDSAYPGVFSREDFKRSRWEVLPKLDVKDFKKSRK